MLLCTPTLESELNWRFAYNQQNADVTLWFLRVSQKKLHSFQLSLLGGLLQGKPVTRKKSICHGLTDAVRNPKLAKQRTHVRRQRENSPPTHTSSITGTRHMNKNVFRWPQSQPWWVGKNMRGPKMSLTVVEPWEIFGNSLVRIPGGAMVKNLPANAGERCKRCEFAPWVGKIPWRRKWQPLQYSCPGNPMDRGAWWAAVHGVAKSWTWLSRHTQLVVQWLRCHAPRAGGLVSIPDHGARSCVPQLRPGHQINKQYLMARKKD